MSLIQELFGKSPFGPLVEHARKVHECVLLVRPLMEACIGRDAAENTGDLLRRAMPQDGGT